MCYIEIFVVVFLFLVCLYFFCTCTLYCIGFPDHETAIMHRLQGVILEHSAALINVMELSAELDW